MFRDLRFDQAGHAINHSDGAVGAESRVQDIREPIQEFTLKGWVFEKFSQKKCRGWRIVVVAPWACLILFPWPIRFDVVSQHIELPGRRHAPKSSPTDIIVKLQPTPPSLRRSRSPEPVIADIPSVIKNLRNLI